MNSLPNQSSKCQRIAKIYLVENIINQKKYIGFTTMNAAKRWHHHVWMAKHGSLNHLHSAIRKYGPENFNVTEIYYSKDLTHTLSEMEPYFIHTFDSFLRGYNMTAGGDGRLNAPHNEATKEKMRSVWTPERRAEASKRFSLLPRTEEHKRHIGAALKGRKRSPEEIEKLRKALTGRKLTPEHIQKMREHVVTEKTRAKMSVAKKGKKQNPIFIEKRAASLRGRKCTPEQIEANRQAQLALHRKDSIKTLQRKREARQKYLENHESNAVRKWILWHKDEANSFTVTNLEKWSKEHNLRADSLQKAASGARKSAYGYRVWRYEKAPEEILQLLNPHNMEIFQMIDQ